MKPLVEIHDTDGALSLRSELLLDSGFQHAFSTAIGPEGSVFDLSSPTASRAAVDAEARSTNRNRFDRLFPDSEGVITTRQIHGANVVMADDAPLPGDALVAASPHQIVGVRTADCVSVLLADPASGLVAAVHAGWRGLVSNVIAATIRRMHQLTSHPARLLAAIGPAIGREAFEIGPEVASQFVDAGLRDAVFPGDPRPHADLHLAAQIRLQDSGIPASRIEGSGICTYTDGRFFSYRRSGSHAGSHLAAIQAGSSIELMRE